MTIAAYKLQFRRELAESYSIAEIDSILLYLVEKTTGLNRWEQRTHEESLSKESQIYLDTAINHLRTGMPYQQIMGETSFYGLHFFVSQHVLIPRPETEELVELAIQTIKQSGLENAKISILDIGTGSGIIPIVLKKHFPNALVCAVDFSEDALVVAKKNASFNQVDILFEHADYLKQNLSSQYDIIISNPPYIGQNEKSEIEAAVQNFEPNLALFSPSDDPLIFYRKIAMDCVHFLHASGLVFLEINQKLGKETLQLFENVLSESYLIKDLSGNDRFVYGRK